MVQCIPSISHTYCCGPVEIMDSAVHKYDLTSLAVSTVQKCFRKLILDESVSRTWRPSHSKMTVTVDIPASDSDYNNVHQ